MYINSSKWMESQLLDIKRDTANIYMQAFLLSVKIKHHQQQQQRLYTLCHSDIKEEAIKDMHCFL